MRTRLAYKAFAQKGVKEKGCGGSLGVGNGKKKEKEKENNCDKSKEENGNERFVGIPVFYNTKVNSFLVDLEIVLYFQLKLVSDST